MVRNREKCLLIDRWKKLDKVQITTQTLVKSNLDLEFLGYVLVTLLLIFSLQNTFIIITIIIVATHEHLG